MDKIKIPFQTKNVALKLKISNLNYVLKNIYIYIYINHLIYE